MTLLEFCEGWFPNKGLFYEMEGLLVVELRRLFAMEHDRYRKDRASRYRVKPTDILRAVAPWTGECFFPSWEMPEEVFLSEEETGYMKNIRLEIDPGVAGIQFDVRRPYFRMRGRRVTEEQAFDIIRCTDNFFLDDMDEYRLDGLVGDGLLLDSILYSPNFYPHPHGWVRPDGVIGANDISWKYPNEMELVDPLLRLMITFPYLDLMIGMTDWDEHPDYVKEAFYRNNDDSGLHRENYPDFEEHIIYGIRLHDGTLELMAPARARKKYAEYRRLYAGPNEDIFWMDYYQDNHIHPADFEYLKRCIRSHGLDPEEVLARYEWDPVKGLRHASAPK